MLPYASAVLWPSMTRAVRWRMLQGEVFRPDGTAGGRKTVDRTVAREVVGARKEGD
jgi:hypothetical protein